MLSRERIEGLLDTVLNASKADQTEVTVISRDSYLTRFANNRVHQNVGDEDSRVGVRTVVGKRSFVSSTNTLDAESLKAFVDQMVTLTELQPEVESFPGLPRSPENFDAVAWDDATAQCSPEHRADLVNIAINRARQERLDSAGILATEGETLAVANSLGNRSFFRHSHADFSFTAAGDETAQTGWTYLSARNLGDLDIASYASTVVEKALANKEKSALEPGKYTVILEPAAVADLISFLMYIGFGGQGFVEKRTFMADELGHDVTPPHVTLTESPHHSRILDAPFDFEGMPKQTVPLIDRGVARNVVHDSVTSHLSGMTNTGHAQPAGTTMGPMPVNLCLDEGSASREQLIRDTENGILITRLWYNRVVDFRKTIITGMTRDGTFHVKDGKIVGALRNMRYNQSILEALANIDGLSNFRDLIREGGYRALVPMARIRDFRFTGVTDF